MLLFLLLIASAHADTDFRCDPSYWVTEPEFIDDTFRGTREAKCYPKLTKSVQDISTDLRKDLESNNKILSGPSTSGDTTTYIVLDESEDLKITENISSTIKENSLIWDIASTKIEGSGTNGYLRKVEASAKVTKEVGYMVVYKNTVWVERPWYAPVGLFKGMAADKFEGKFEEAKDKFLRKLGL